MRLVMPHINELGSKSVAQFNCFTGNFVSKDGKTGDVACDSYNKVDVDIQLLKNLGVTQYRYSIVTRLSAVYAFSLHLYCLMLSYPVKIITYY